MNNFENGYHGDSEDLPASRPYNGNPHAYKDSPENIPDGTVDEAYREVYNNEKPEDQEESFNVKNKYEYMHGEYEDTSPNSRIWDSNVRDFVEQENTKQETNNVVENDFEETSEEESTETQKPIETDEEDVQNIKKQGMGAWIRGSNESDVIFQTRETETAKGRGGYGGKQNLKTMPENKIQRIHRSEIRETLDGATLDDMSDENFMPIELLEG